MPDNKETFWDRMQKDTEDMYARLAKSKSKTHWLYIFLKNCLIIVAFVFLGVLSWRFAWIDFNVDLSKFEFSDLLALIMGLFAIAMSVAFYFKATDTSNKFYDNVYKFTQETSEILGRIEAGFGERLRHLDEGYTGLQSRFDKFSSMSPEESIKKVEKNKEREEKS